MRWCLVEPASDGETGSIGAFYVAETVRRLGHTVDIIAPETPRYGYDVELISIHHPEDYPRLQRIPKHGRIRIIGGHVTYNNPRPIIPLADVVCLGDGESWITEAARRLEQERTIKNLRDLPGTILAQEWSPGAELPARNYEQPLPENPPYLNRPNTLSAAWYLEIARGCPYKCGYCELGHSMPYRYRKTEDVLTLMRSLDTLETRKIVWFAPDEASHPGYSAFLAEAKRLKLRQAFGSYRLDKVLKMGGISIAANQLIRVGIDGLTEETRKRVKKPITDKQIVRYFKLMIAQGHVNFKIFQMFAHSWEQPRKDFQQWERVMNIVLHLPVTKSVSLRLKWTPFIPQPITPLGRDPVVYQQETTRLINAWHEKVRQPQQQPGWHVECDGLMSAKNHVRQVKMTHGDETLLLKNARWIHPAWRKE